MKLSHIKIQQSIISIHSKKSKEEIETEISCRSNGNTNQISILNSLLDISQGLSMQGNIEILGIRKCTILGQNSGFIFGENIKILELMYCNLKKMPNIRSSQLAKLNLSHNLIEEVTHIPCRVTLRWMDLRDNRITYLTSEFIKLPQLKIQHQLLHYTPQTLKDLACSFEDKKLLNCTEILQNLIYSWDDKTILMTCEQIIHQNNDHLLDQLMDYLNDELITKIYEISRLKRKHNILQLLIRSGKVNEITKEDRVMLLLPELLPVSILRTIRLEMIIQSISASNSYKNKITTFLKYLQSIQREFTLLQSQKDLIDFMSFSSKYPHSYQHQFLLAHNSFLLSYQFQNQIIIRYFLQLDSVDLLKLLLSCQNFRQKALGQLYFKKMLKPNSKLYKMLLIAMKQHKKQTKSACNNWYYPQYRERKSFCIKNDLYDYEILQEYQEMQCSYLRKDFKYTIKVYNKENQMSVAKKIENQLKKSKVKAFRANSELLRLSHVN